MSTKHAAVRTLIIVLTSPTHPIPPAHTGSLRPSPLPLRCTAKPSSRPERACDVDVLAEMIERLLQQRVLLHAERALSLSRLLFLAHLDRFV